MDQRTETAVYLAIGLAAVLAAFLMLYQRSGFNSRSSRWKRVVRWWKNR